MTLFLRRPGVFVAFMIVLILAFVQHIFSQNPRAVDSLENLLKTKEGKDRWEPLYELAFEYVEKDYQRALDILDEAYEVSLLTGDSLKIVRSLRVKGQMLGRLDKSIEQMQCYARALPVAKRNQFIKEIYYMLNGIGNLHLVTGEFDKALDHHLQAFQLVRDRADTSEMAQSLNNLGLLFYKMNNPSKALEYYQESVQLRTLIRFPKKQMVFAFLNIAICNCEIGRIKEAEQAIQTAKEGCDTLSLARFQFSITFNEGCIAFAKGNYVDAKRAYMKSYQLSKAINDRRFQVDNLLAVSKIALKQNDQNSRKEALDSALTLLDDHKPLLRESLAVYNLLFEYYLDVKNYAQATKYQNLYIELNDKVSNLNFATRMMEVESRYLNKQHAAELLAEKEISLLKEEVIYRQKIGNILMGGLVLMLLVIVGAMVSIIRNKRKINRYLEACVQRRTKELQEKTEHLLRLNLERNAKVNQLCCQLKQFLATVTGLTLLTRLEDNHAISSLQNLARIKQEISDILTDVSGAANVINE
jgi:tetratricopeptide (TPR) repeat protein